MMSQPHTDPERETLSALFDGELQGDAARFALKRLGHDAQWRHALGNWQLLGDALRGQASVAAPCGFAARVAAAVAVEPVPVAAAEPVSTMGSSAPAASRFRRKWFGGAALAASVAMVAMFVARPFSQDPAVAPGSTTPALTELAIAPNAASAEGPTHVKPAAASALQLSGAAVAVAAVPRRADERLSRGQSQRAALRASKRQQLPTPAVARASTPTAMAINEAGQASDVNPFNPVQTEVVVRPWPRAVLPGAPAAGAFTASYGGTGSSPSFYPFEPRLPHADDATPGQINADNQRP